jgi:exodeoxyribonuclease VII small subunit
MAGFEKHLTQLETVVERLEKGDLTLDESVRLFEEGMKLSQSCKQELEQAEGRVQVLVEGKGGKMQVAEMVVEEDEEVEVDEGEDEDEDEE